MLSYHPVTRTFDAEAVNAICNDAAVLPGLGLGENEVDVTEAMRDERNIFFLGQHGGAYFHWSAPRVWDAHDFFLKSGRGPWALEASRFMLRTMFQEHGARLIWAHTPIEHRACRLFNRWLGFRSEGVGKTVMLPGGSPVDVETFVMEGPQCP